MAKIRTVEALDEAIDSEIYWRKQELTTTLQLVKQSRGPAQRANLRAGVVILYAHWEGWVKNVAQFYIRYVNSRAYSYDQLSAAFLGTALKSKINSAQDASKSLPHTTFAKFIQTELSSRAALSTDLVRTESNLSSVVFNDIVDRLGLPKRDLYASREKMIDVELVGRRNTIAHGEYLNLGPDDFEALRDGTLTLLSLFTDDVRNAASTDNHLAPKPKLGSNPLRHS